jgi:hypothetical protein
MGEQEITLSGYAAPAQGRDPSHHAAYRRQLEDFCEAIRARREPFVGREGKKSIALIEACYAKRQPIEYPWRFRASSVPSDHRPVESAV